MNKMKIRSAIILPLLLAVFGLAAFYPQYDYKEREALILHAVMQYMENLHFKPQPVDDAFSEKVLQNYLKSTDPNKRFLTKDEIAKLFVHEKQIDDQIKLRTFEFFDLSVSIIDEAVIRAENIFKEVIDYPIDITKEELHELDPEKRTYANDELELREVWKKSIKYDVIAKMYGKKKNQDEDLEKDEEVEVKTLEEFKIEAIEEVKENYEDWFKRLYKIRRSDRFENYVNAITHIYDPHTDYFNPKEKEDFDIRMGGKLEGIGARLMTDGDYTKVSSIIPGGPAWKGKELEVNDLITAVTQKGGEPFDITGMRIDDVVQKIRGDKGTVVILTVKKPDATIQEIEIERDEVIIDEGFARSLMLQVPESMDNVGYIKLPKFYSSFEGKDGNSCSADIAEEIEKLKNNNVSGIILDLRNNGGGSLNDVVSMSGFFIEDGPIVQVKPKQKAAYVYDDEDPKVNYDGPLIVMVNQFSASASEILAAALQDYDRAIIVGSNSTFGKGTVQRFADLDRVVNGNDEMKPLGQIKITMQKFYRINGGSTQLKGVEPDIVLPDAYHYIETGEKEYESPLEWSEVNSVPYGQDVFPIDFKEDIVALSNERTCTNETFKTILENAKRVKEIRDITKYPLSFDSFENMMEERETEADRFEGLFEDDLETIISSNIPEDLEYMALDSSRIARNEEWVKDIKKDVYLEETLLIMRDLQEMSKFKK